MGVVDSKTFRSGNSVAVHLPEDIAFPPDTRVTIERNGDVLTIRPVVDAAEEQRQWHEMLRELDAMPKPSSIQDRHPIEFPERPGL